jgi:hypothetical protein
MNLYKFHQSPEDLHKHDSKEDHVIELFWDKYADNPKELKKREAVIAKSAKYSYLYAIDVLHGKFLLGEPAIAKSADYSYWYARNVLKGKSPLGEPAIAKDVLYSYWYAKYVLKGRFKLGEPAIEKDENYWNDYRKRFGIKK